MRKRMLRHVINFFWRQSSRVGGTMWCANRQVRTVMLGSTEVTVTLRDTKEPDAYSREEIYRMFQTVRENEQRMGWKVPEPTR